MATSNRTFDRLKRDFFRLEPVARLAVGILGLMLLFIIYDQWHYWTEIEDYSFGFLVPFFVFFVLGDRWPRMRAYLFNTTPPPPPSGHGALAALLERIGPLLWWAALAVAFGSLIVFGLGGLVRVSQGPGNLASLMLAVGFAGGTFSLVYLNFGRDGSGRPPPVYNRTNLTLLFMFPALIWFLSTPMIVDAIGLPLILQGWVAVLLTDIFNMFGATIIRTGNVLMLPNGGEVGVADACSGIRSLTACMFAGSFLGAIFLNRFWKKVVLVGMSMIFAFLLNLARSAFLTVWAMIHGSGAIDLDFWGNPREIENEVGIMVDNPEFFLGTVHDVAGYGVLAVTFVLLVGLLPLLNINPEPAEERTEDERPTPEPEGDPQTA